MLSPCRGIVVLTCLLTNGLSPEGEKAPAAQGGPLPEGAVLRVGTGPMHHQGVRQLAFTADGRYFASAGESECYVWDMQTGRQVGRHPPFGSPASREPPAI
jgi:hypothetical protein